MAKPQVDSQDVHYETISDLIQEVAALRSVVRDFFEQHQKAADNVDRRTDDLRKEMSNIRHDLSEQAKTSSDSRMEHEWKIEALRDGLSMVRNQLHDEDVRALVEQQKKVIEETNQRISELEREVAEIRMELDTEIQISSESRIEFQDFARLRNVSRWLESQVEALSNDVYCVGPDQANCSIGQGGYRSWYASDVGGDGHARQSEEHDDGVVGSQYSRMRYTKWECGACGDRVSRKSKACASCGKWTCFTCAFWCTICKSNVYCAPCNEESSAIKAYRNHYRCNSCIP